MHQLNGYITRDDTETGVFCFSVVLGICVEVYDTGHERMRDGILTDSPGSCELLEQGKYLTSIRRASGRIQIGFLRPVTST